MNYVNAAYMHVGRNTYSRFRIGHQKPRETFNDDICEELRVTEDIAINISPIQAHSEVCIGWLLGAHPSTFNTQEYADALKAHSLIKGADVDVRPLNFKLEPRKSFGEDIRVVHIFCAKSQAGKMKTSLNKIYGSSRKSDSFPLGRNYRFVPFTADPYQPATNGLKRLATEAILQQKAFIDSMAVMESDAIIGLDYYLKKPVDATLREVVMAMKASDGSTNLFDSVDTRRNGAVAFLIHEDLHREATSIIPFLPLIMEAKFGPRSWGWFKDDVKLELSGMFWDKDAGKVRSSEESNLAADLAQWSGADFIDVDDDSDDDELKSPRFDLAVQIDLTESREQYQLFGENRSLKTFRDFVGDDDTIATQHSEDTNTPNPSSGGGINTDQNSAVDTSTLTANSAEELAKLFIDDPDFRERVQNETARLASGSTENSEKIGTND